MKKPEQTTAPKEIVWAAQQVAAGKLDLKSDGKSLGWARQTHANMVNKEAYQAELVEKISADATLASHAEAKYAEANKDGALDKAAQAAGRTL